MSKDGGAIYDVNELDNYRKRVENYLKEYQGSLPIYKLRNNEELTKGDMAYFEKILFEEIGSEEEYKQAYGEKRLLELVASITGMDRQAAERQFSKFLDDENLNANQIDFVNNIIDYIVKNGSLDKHVLQEYPFNKNGGVVKLFQDSLGVVEDIISTIDKVNDRLSI